MVTVDMEGWVIYDGMVGSNVTVRGGHLVDDGEPSASHDIGDDMWRIGLHW